MTHSLAYKTLEVFCFKGFSELNKTVLLEKIVDTTSYIAK